MESDHAHTQVKIQDLYPELSEVQWKEAEENLCRYFRVALQIHQGTEHAPTVLDGSFVSPKMEERSNPSLKI